MKKRLFSLLLVSALVFTLSGCGEKSLLRESDPVTLNFWHVYGRMTMFRQEQSTRESKFLEGLPI